MSNFSFLGSVSGTCLDGGGGGWGKAENKAKLSPAGAGSWAELGNSGPHKLLCWLHACRSDQNHLSFKLVKIVSIACGQPLCKRYITTQMSILYDEDYYD